MSLSGTILKQIWTNLISCISHTFTVIEPLSLQLRYDSNCWTEKRTWVSITDVILYPISTPLNNQIELISCEHNDIKPTKELGRPCANELSNKCLRSHHFNCRTWEQFINSTMNLHYRQSKRTLYTDEQPPEI